MSVSTNLGDKKSISIPHLAPIKCVKNGNDDKREEEDTKGPEEGIKNGRKLVNFVHQCLIVMLRGDEATEGTSTLQIQAKHLHREVVFLLALEAGTCCALDRQRDRLAIAICKEKLKGF